MSKLKKSLWTILRLGIGAGIVAFLLVRIQNGSILVEFAVETATVEAGAIYLDSANDGSRFVVMDPSKNTTTLKALVSGIKQDQIPDTGTLLLTNGNGPTTLSWSARTCSAQGLELLGHSFATAWQNWAFLLAGLSCFCVCLMICTVRWKLILDAQGLELPLRRVCSIMFVGHFFNAFMLGATGGDVVKAYYTAKETGHKKTEAVSTVFIDRVIGLAGLIILTMTVMLCRLDFILSNPKTKTAFIFIATATAALLGGAIFMILIRKFLDRSALLRNLMATRPGKIVMRIYDSFYLCFTRPSILLYTGMISIFNHFMVLTMMYCLGRALLIKMSFLDYFTVGPIVNSVSAIPLTPAGIGLREYAAIEYLDILGVSATKAFPLSLLIYASMLIWSLVGGVVYMLFSDKVEDSSSG